MGVTSEKYLDAFDKNISQPSLKRPSCSSQSTEWIYGGQMRDEERTVVMEGAQHTAVLPAPPLQPQSTAVQHLHVHRNAPTSHVNAPIHLRQAEHNGALRAAEGLSATTEEKSHFLWRCLSQLS